MKHICLIFAFVVLAAPLSAQDETVFWAERPAAGAEQEYVVNFNFNNLVTTATDSLELFDVPAKCVVEKIVVVQDTLVEQLDSIRVSLRENQNTLATVDFRPEGGQAADDNNYMATTRPDQATEAIDDKLVLHLFSAASAASGQIRIFVVIRYYY